MKQILSKLAVFLGAGLFALAVTTAPAQSLTNFITFTLTVQHTGDETDNGAVTTVPLVTLKIANKDLLAFLAQDANALGLYPTNVFPAGTKLAIIDGSIVVLTKTNTLIVDVSDIFSMDSSYGYLETGKFSDTTYLSSPSSTELGRIKFTFDDTWVLGGNDLSFEMVGLAKSTYTDSVPNSTTGVYTESQSHTVSAMAGDGYKDGGFFVISGTAKASGKASFVY